MSERKRFTKGEEEVIKDEIWNLLVLQHNTANIIKAMQSRYNRSERQIRRYVNDVKTSMLQFGSEKLSVVAARNLARAEHLYAKCVQKSEVDVKNALKAIELLQTIAESMEKTNAPQNQGLTLSAGLLEALEKDEKDGAD